MLAVANQDFLQYVNHLNCESQSPAIASALDIRNFVML